MSVMGKGATMTLYEITGLVAGLVIAVGSLIILGELAWEAWSK